MHHIKLNIIELFEATVALCAVYFSVKYPNFASERCCMGVLWFLLGANLERSRAQRGAKKTGYCRSVSARAGATLRISTIYFVSWGRVHIYMMGYMLFVVDLLFFCKKVGLNTLQQLKQASRSSERRSGGRALERRGEESGGGWGCRSRRK